MLTNVRALAGRADDIELLFLESPGPGNTPSAQTIRRLQDVAGRYSLTYTVHLPIDGELGSPSAEERDSILSHALRVIDLAEPLNPCAYILHIEGVDAASDPPAVRAWQRRALPLLRALCARVVPASHLCIENLAYPFEWCAPFLTETAVGICTDMGHLWQGGRDWRQHLRTHLRRTHVIHLYGPAEGSAHGSLRTVPRPMILDFLEAIGDYAGVLTIETFGYDDTRTSLETLSECLTVAGHNGGRQA
jgi:sugar phosphate isomerase/epimerase